MTEEQIRQRNQKRAARADRISEYNLLVDDLAASDDMAAALEQLRVEVLSRTQRKVGRANLDRIVSRAVAAAIKEGR